MADGEGSEGARIQELERQEKIIQSYVCKLEEDARQHAAFKVWIDGKIQSDLEWTECMRHMKPGQLPPFCQPGQCVAGCGAC